MSVKEKILANIKEYSAREIAEAIIAGDVTYYELSKSGQFTPLMKKRVKNIIDNNFEETERPDLSQNSESELDNLEQVECNPTTLESEPEPDVAPEMEPEPFKEPDLEAEDMPSRMTPNQEYNRPVAPNRLFQFPFSFKGRIRRKEFFLTHLLSYVFHNILLSCIAFVDSDLLLGVISVLYVTCFPFLLWIYFAQGSKRCHDVGKSGWFQFIPLYIIFLFFLDSERRENKYGVCPKIIYNNAQ